MSTQLSSIVLEATRTEVERYITVALHQHAQGISLPFVTCGFENPMLRALFYDFPPGVRF